MAVEMLAQRPFRQERRATERVRIMGHGMDLVRPEEVMLQVKRRLAEGKQTIVANHNLHSLYLCQREPELAAFYDVSTLVEVDSTPLLTWARLTQDRGRAFHRCTYLDWRDLFWSLALTEGWRIFYLGGAPGVAEQAAAKLRHEWPGVQIATHDGYFDMDAAPGPVIDAINAYQPHILLVGMGMPRQEIFIGRHHRCLGPCGIFSVGAAFDYEAGVQTPAPRWMGRVGVEWLFRLLSDPKRLFRRYCVEPWSLIAPALKDVKIALKRSSS